MSDLKRIGEMRRKLRKSERKPNERDVQGTLHTARQTYSQMAVFQLLNYSKFYLALRNCHPSHPSHPFSLIFYEEYQYFIPIFDEEDQFCDKKERNPVSINHQETA